MGESAEGIVLLVVHSKGPGSPGRAEIVEATHSIPLVATLDTVDELVSEIRQLRAAYMAKTRERRYLKIFRRDHYDFLREYVEVRRKIAAHVGPEQS